MWLPRNDCIVINNMERLPFCFHARGFIILMTVLLCPSVCMSNETDHVVQGKVIDNLTGMGLDSVSVILMTADSVPLDTTKALPKEAGRFVGRYSLSVRKVGRYIVKAVRNGYDDGFVDFRLRSNRKVPYCPVTSV